MKELYDQKEVSRLIGISESQIRYWDKIGLIPHLKRQRGRLFFDFKGLVAFRTVKELLDKGISLRKIRRCIKNLKKMMPEIKQPLTEMRISIYGDQIILGRDNLKFTPEGQLLIDFSADVKTPISFPVDAAEELFFQALECEQEEDWEGAKRKYEAVLALRPNHVDALVNLGNIAHRSGSCTLAEQHYRKALRIDPDHAEANYNLANILEEKDDLNNAILFYQKAIHEDPEFADAHFNLARALERIGDIKGAEKHWRSYLNLDPTSEWAEYIRRRLDEGKPL
ncbi:MAG: hypothetical protein DRG50_07425 [Deltaproteobacteria bacterium]|nr:MAG: hypothetical protein DRG50_07425 [Deltaproteobacteria bacterium]